MSASGRTAPIVRKPATADRRIERTRQALMTGFIDLLLKGGYEALTINAVIERANVGRSTFYEHYTGKEDILRESLARPFSALAGTIGATAQPPSLLAMVAHFRENQRLARTLFAPPTRPLLVRVLASHIEPRLPPGTKLQLPAGLLALHLAEAQLGLLDHWLTSKFTCRAETIAEAIFATTQALVTAHHRRSTTL